MPERPNPIRSGAIPPGLARGTSAPSRPSSSGSRAGTAPACRAPVARRSPVEDGRLVEVDRVLVDAHPPARITSARVTSTSPDKRTSPDKPPPGAPTLCLGDPIVEFVCERPVASVSEATRSCPAFRWSGRERLGRCRTARRARRPRRRRRRRRPGGAGSVIGWRVRASRGSGSTWCRAPRLRWRSSPWTLRDGRAAKSMASGSRRRRAFEPTRRCGPRRRCSSPRAARSESEVTMRARELALSLGRPIVVRPADSRGPNGGRGPRRPRPRTRAFRMHYSCARARAMRS